MLSTPSAIPGNSTETRQVAPGPAAVPVTVALSRGGMVQEMLTGIPTMIWDDGSTASVAEEPLAQVGRELHDGVVQDLWYLHFRLSSLMGQIPLDCPELRAELEEVKEVSRGAYEGLRKVLGALKTRGRSSRNSVDLVVALAQVKEKFAGAPGLPIQFSLVPPGLEMQVSPYAAHQACMLVQEALWNAYRHSNADTVLVVMHQTESGVVVAISDDGQGFDPHQTREGHYGLETMRLRAESVHGKLAITSRPGEGTRIVFHLPPEGRLGDADEGVSV